MEQERKIRVAITHGDPNGVGYEIILKAFEDPTMLELYTPIIFGSPKVAAFHRKAMGIETQLTTVSNASDAKDGRVNILAATDEEIKVEIGQPTAEARAAARKALDRALADQEQGLFDVLVTAPAKANDELLRKPEALPVLVTDDLCMAFVTKDVATKDASELITKQKIVEKAKTLHTCLKRDMRVSNPRIAVLALNPHTGEQEPSGELEKEVIAPAIDELEQLGIQAFGPYTADSFFSNGDYSLFDAVLAMYYDQGVAPLKALVGDEYSVLITGLPFVCTAPSQDAAHQQAGKGVTNASSMLRAIYLATNVYRNRINYDLPLKNPLPKLYHEKRDDSEKVRFTVPKDKKQ